MGNSAKCGALSLSLLLTKETPVKFAVLLLWCVCKCVHPRGPWGGIYFCGSPTLPFCRRHWECARWLVPIRAAVTFPTPRPRPSPSHHPPCFPSEWATLSLKCALRDCHTGWRVYSECEAKTKEKLEEEEEEERRLDSTSEMVVTAACHWGSVRRLLGLYPSSRKYNIPSSCQCSRVPLSLMN